MYLELLTAVILLVVREIPVLHAANLTKHSLLEIRKGLHVLNFTHDECYNPS